MKKIGKRKTTGRFPGVLQAGLMALMVLAANGAMAQKAMTKTYATEGWMSSPGVVGTLVLMAIVLFVAVMILTARVKSYLHRADEKRTAGEPSRLSPEEEERLAAARSYKLRGDELGGTAEAFDDKALVSSATSEPDSPLVAEKIYTRTRLKVDPKLTKLVVAYIGASAFWLVFGTLVGQYLGLKFVWPDMDNAAWLSFGRLRPVHTNTVFWGWASMAMVGLGYFVIARTSLTRIYSYKLGWWAFGLMNLAVLMGNLMLMGGINNGGGEYREYIWPVMAPFAVGMFITFRNFYATVKRRKVSEIYVSNWYILASLVWTLVVVTIGYLPWYQEGLGETVIQGYYMHMGVGIWFMTYTLGLIYYYLPSALNKPIYSYSLGVLAFWTQVLFYTLIGTHHFIFSPLPWWLQTVAVVFSIGMFIPVFAGTANFLLTMRGSWSSIGKSYVLPFFLVGVIFYFVGSSQGSFQALRFTNHMWHFTDFNVAHSHMTMYGIINFILWAAVYALLPKITGREPSQLLVGAHFWLAFIGLFAYTFSLMAGGTVKGLAWMEGVPFIQTVVATRGYWIWRAVGGSLMFISHLIFAWNFYVMASKPKGTPRSAIIEPVTT